MGLVRLIVALAVLGGLFYIVTEVPFSGRTLWSRVRGAPDEVSDRVQHGVSEHTRRLGRKLDRAVRKPMERLEEADRAELRRVLENVNVDPER